MAVAPAALPPDLHLLFAVLPIVCANVLSYLGTGPKALQAADKLKRPIVLPNGRTVRAFVESFHPTIYTSTLSLLDKLSESRALVDGCLVVELDHGAHGIVQDLLSILADIISTGKQERNGTLRRLCEKGSIDSDCLMCPPDSLRRGMKEKLDACTKAFQAITKELLPLPSAQRRFLAEAKAVTLWKTPKDICAGLGTVHKRIREQTTCAQHVSHASRISFSHPYTTDVYVLQMETESNTWHRLRLSLDPGTTHPLVPVESLCQMLQQHNGKICLVAQGDHYAAHVEKSERSVYGRGMTSLAHWLREGQPTQFNIIGKKQRLVLAVLISYYFLHLGGGPYWPSTGDLPDFWFGPTVDGEAFELFQPFLALQPATPLVDVVYRNTQQAVDTQAFGKLLLEIWFGRCLDWCEIHTMEDDLEDHDKDFYLSAKYAWKRTQHCDSSLVDERTKQELKHDVSQVIKGLQLILRSYHIYREEDILHRPDLRNFARPKHGKITEYRTQPLQMTRKSAYSINELDRVRSQLDQASSTKHELKVCQHGNGDDESFNKSRKEFAEHWWRRLHDTHAFLRSTQAKPSPRRIKVAILDSGLRFDKSTASMLYGSRIRECRTWCDTGSLAEGRECDPEDLLKHGKHGTHCASMLLDADERCIIYIAKIHDDDSNRSENTLSDIFESRITNAIKYAREIWKVDIVSMSFGYRPSPLKTQNRILREIELCQRAGPLLFAAASNDGGNAPPTFPAICHGVIPVYATDGFGNAYERNPKGGDKHIKLATLGWQVHGWLDLASEKKGYMSGTSVATPIAAAAAASIMSFMDNSKEQYLASLPPGSNLEDERRLYEKNTMLLRTVRGMEKVLQLMVGASNKKSLHFLEPWVLLKKPESGHPLAVHEIIKVLTPIYYHHATT